MCRFNHREIDGYVLHQALQFFPFAIIGFHSDNGGENINGSVGLVLQKLLVEQTKSRSGKCNDNALIESKNGSVVSTWDTGTYRSMKRKINAFYRDCFNEFLNFHRMCAYLKQLSARMGKKKKIYDETSTPCQKLLSIPDVEMYLKKILPSKVSRKK